MNSRPTIGEAHADVLGVDQAISRSAVQFSGGTEPAALIENVLTRYHAVHRAQLLDPICMEQRVAAVRRENPLVPAGPVDLLESRQHELLSQVETEEAILIPMLQAGGNRLVGQPIAIMRAERVDHGAVLEELAVRTNVATPPQGACNTWRAPYAGVAKFHDDLTDHLHLETNPLFAQFDTFPPAHVERQFVMPQQRPNRALK